MPRLLGLDPGTRRCGVAVSDTAGTLAFPRPALDADDTLEADLARVIEDEGIEEVVVGRPLALSGSPTASTAVADEFFARLGAVLAPLPVRQWDERLTSVQATRSLREAGLSARRQRDHVDSAAAVIMLQSYLDANRAP